MHYRHEWKYEITLADRIAIRRRLQAIASPDPHARNGEYMIRSLYFDTPADKALREKLDGVSRREKFRIRYYNGDTSVIHLEKKSKWNGLGSKESAPLSRAEALSIAEGEWTWMKDADRPLVRELYRKMRDQLMRPKTIVDYTREPYIYAPGNVRVTFDFDVRTGLSCTDFLNPDCTTIPAWESSAGAFSDGEAYAAPVLMEVKWDAFLPDVIKDAIRTPGRHAESFSKYARCRVYG